MAQGAQPQGGQGLLPRAQIQHQLLVCSPSNPSHSSKRQEDNGAYFGPQGGGLNRSWRLAVGLA